MNIPLSHWIVFVGACAFVGWLNGRRARVQTPATPSLPKGAIRHISPAGAPVLTPPVGNWCHCCGRETAPPWLWCDDCLFHVELAGEKPLHERTWYAQHGTLCPFLDLPAGSWVRPESPDVVPEGLGVTPAPRPSPVSASGQWTAAERALFDEIHDRVAR